MNKILVNIIALGCAAVGITLLSVFDGLAVRIIAAVCFIVCAVIACAKIWLNDKSQNKSRLHLAYLVCFAVMLFTPLALQISSVMDVPAEKFKQSENRSPAELDFTDKEILQYPEVIDSWFEDNFGLRRQMVSLNEVIRLSVGVNLYDSSKVVGKNDFLFKYGHDKDSGIRLIRNIRRFSQSQLDARMKALLARKKYLEDRGIEFYVLIVPALYCIYPEYLPDWCTKVSKKPTAREQFVQACKDNGINIVDPTDYLLEQKQQYGDYLYYKRDHHWTRLGGSLVSYYLLDKINPDIKHNSIKSCDFYYGQHEGRDPDVVEDHFANIVFDYKRDVIEIPRNEDIPKAPQWERGMANIWKEKPDLGQPDYRAVILGESFMDNCKDVFNSAFSHVEYRTYYHERGYENMAEQIELARPQYFILMFWEQHVFNNNAENPDQYWRWHWDWTRIPDSWSSDPK